MKRNENPVRAVEVTRIASGTARPPWYRLRGRSHLIDSLRFVIAMVVVATSALAFAQVRQDGFIEVRGVGIDGAEVFVGRSSMGEVEDGVLLIRNIPPGGYTLRVDLPGYFPREFDVLVEAGLVTAVEVGVVLPVASSEVDASLSANTVLVATSASLALMCFPMACDLLVLDAPDSLLIGAGQDERNENEDDAEPLMTFRREFGDATLTIRGLPQGAYRFRVVGELEETEFALGMCHGETLGVFVDFAGRFPDALVTESRYPDCPALPSRSLDDAAR